MQPTTGNSNKKQLAATVAGNFFATAQKKVNFQSGNSTTHTHTHRELSTSTVVVQYDARTKAIEFTDEWGSEREGERGREKVKSGVEEELQIEIEFVAH